MSSNIYDEYILYARKSASLTVLTACWEMIHSLAVTSQTIINEVIDPDNLTCAQEDSVGMTYCFCFVVTWVVLGGTVGALGMNEPAVRASVTACLGGFRVA